MYLVLNAAETIETKNYLWKFFCRLINNDNNKKKKEEEETAEVFLIILDSSFFRSVLHAHKPELELG